MHDPAQVLVLDMQADRLALIEKVGCTPINVTERNAATAVDEMTEGRGADVVLECVGHPSAFESAVGVVMGQGEGGDTAALESANPESDALARAK